MFDQAMCKQVTILLSHQIPQCLLIHCCAGTKKKQKIAILTEIGTYENNVTHLSKYQCQKSSTVSDDTLSVTILAYC